MAVVEISSAATTFTASVIVSSTGTATINGSTHIITLDLAALGSNPNITGVAIVCTTSKRDDRFYLTAPTPKKRLTVDQSTATPELKDYMTGGSLALTINYQGGIYGSGTGRTYNFSTTATFKLVVTVEGEVVTDRRSSGSLSATSVELGQNAVFTVEPFRETFRHAVTYGVGGTYTSTVTLQPGITQVTLAPPIEWAGAITNSVTGTLTVILDTLVPVDEEDPETTYISAGTREYSMQATVPDTPAFRPSASPLSVAAVNPGALAGSTQIFAGVSQLDLTLPNIQTKYGAGIRSIIYSGWGSTITSTGTPVRTDIVQLSGSLVLTAVVTDTRGRTSQTYTYDATALQFTPPSFTAMPTCMRCTPQGLPDDRGTALKVVASFTCDTQMIPGNTARAFAFIRPYRSEQWAPADGVELTSGVERILTSADIGFELSHEVSYEVRFVVRDSVMAVDLYYRLPSLQYALHFSNSGRSLGIGQQAEALTEYEEGRLDVNPDWTVTFGNNVYIGSQTLAEYIQNIVSAMQGS